MKPLRLEVLDRGDGWDVRLTSSYRGKRPTKAETRKLAREVLQVALNGLDEAEYGGSAESDREMLRRDSFLVTKGEGKP